MKLSVQWETKLTKSHVNKMSSVLICKVSVAKRTQSLPVEVKQRGSEGDAAEISQQKQGERFKLASEIWARCQPYECFVCLTLLST